MITEDSLATAQIAQLFGSELLKVQSNAQTDSGAQPNIVNLDPKQFLVNTPHFRNQRKLEEQRLIEMLQREAEAACPLPPSEIPQAPVNMSVPVATTTTEIQRSALTALQIPKPQPTNILVPDSGNCWQSIANSLERIANRLDGVDISIKKRRVKRIKK